VVVFDLAPAVLLVGLALTAHPAGTGALRYRWIAMAAAGAWLLGATGSFAAIHRPLVVLVAVGFPDGRLRTRPAAVACVVALVGAIAGGPAVATGLTAALAWATLDALRARARRVRVPVGVATGLLAVASGAVAAAHFGDPAGTHAETVELVYSASVAAAIALLLGAAIAGRGSRADLVDSVVDLDGADADELVLGGDRAGDAAGFASGRATAHRLLAEHRRLDAELAAQVDAARSARRRLVEVTDTEERAVERLLTAGTAPTIDALAGVLGRLAQRTDQRAGELVARMQAELAALPDELARLVHGLPPSVLAEDGIAAALGDLARRNPSVTVGNTPAARFPVTIENTVWYVCAEATANALKHGANRVDIDVTTDLAAGELGAVVTDDGPGGAVIRGGGGLAGLTDRVGAVGGRLDVSSAAGEGTTVRAWVPLA